MNPSDARLLAPEEAMAAAKAGTTLYRKIELPSGRVIMEAVNLKRRGLKAALAKAGAATSGRRKRRIRKAMRASERLAERQQQAAEESAA